MRTSSRMAVLLGITLLLAALGALHVWGRYASAVRGAASAQMDQAEVEAAATAIHAARRRPAATSLAGMSEAQLAVLLDQAARTAGLGGEFEIDSIRPLPARPVGLRGSATLYRQVRTELTLSDLTMDEMVRLLHALVKAAPGLRVESLHLDQPDGFGVETQWQLRPVVLSYLIYEPDSEKTQ